MIFISHKNEPDHETALIIRKKLKENGIESWIAPEDIAVGKNFAEEIPHAIRTCELFLLLLTAEVQQSPHVLKEINLAIKYRKKIIPVQLGEVELTDSYDYMFADIQIKKVGKNFEGFGEVLNELKMGERVYNVPIGGINSNREFALIKGEFQDNMQWVIENPEINLSETVFVIGIDCSSRLDLSSTKGILKSVIEMLKDQYNISIENLQALVNQAKVEQLGHHDEYQKMQYGDIIVIKILLNENKQEECLQILMIANSNKTGSFYSNNDVDAVEGIDSRIIILRAFEKCRVLGVTASNMMIGAMGTNGLEFPYEVITAEIVNSFIFAVTNNCSPYKLFYSVRIADLDRVGMTTEKIYHYIRNVIRFF